VVMVSGCGGGFDFVHSMTLYPELHRLGKRVIIGSYSFGNPGLITGEAPVVFDERSGDGKQVIVKKVTAASKPSHSYAPEVGVCSFLDEQYPDEAPHFIYAYYARAFTVKLLSKLYAWIASEHAVDAVLLYDGGSDSLVVGDESGLGDPVEDAVSVQTVASLTGMKFKGLISIGLGSDRFNDVSDACSLRAIAELTQAGGFLGSVSLESTSTCFECYSKCVEHIYKIQTFRSVATAVILASARVWIRGTSGCGTQSAARTGLFVASDGSTVGV